MLLPAVPAVVLLQEQNVMASATRANDTVRPTARYQVLTAVDRIGEVDDCLLKCVRFGCHDLILGQTGYFVNYIIAQICPAFPDYRLNSFSFNKSTEAGGPQMARLPSLQNKPAPTPSPPPHPVPATS